MNRLEMAPGESPLSFDAHKKAAIALQAVRLLQEELVRLSEKIEDIESRMAAKGRPMVKTQRTPDLDDPTLKSPDVPFKLERSQDPDKVNIVERSTSKVISVHPKADAPQIVADLNAERLDLAYKELREKWRKDCPYPYYVHRKKGRARPPWMVRDRTDKTLTEHEELAGAISAVQQRCILALQA